MTALIESLGILQDHLWLTLVASLLFAAGLATSIPVVRHDVRWLMAFPLWIVRQVMRIIAPSFPPVRVFLVIFCFNTVAIFLYMVSGVLIIVPAAVAFMTGVNIGVIVLRAGEVVLPSGERPLAGAMSHEEHVEVEPWVSLCGLAVVVLELPSFWVSVGMGIQLGRMLSGPMAYTMANVQKLLAPRVLAYCTVIVPILLVSAIAETAAIRGHLRAMSPGGGDDGTGPPGGHGPEEGSDEERGGDGE